MSSSQLATLVYTPALTVECLQGAEEAYATFDQVVPVWEQFCSASQRRGDQHFEDSRTVLEMFRNFGHFLGEDNYAMFVCRQGEEIEGMMLVRIVKSALGILGLMTHPKNIDSESYSVDGRVKGVGRALLSAADDFAKTRAVFQICLCPTAGAKAFYEKHGYSETEEDVFVKPMT